MVCTFFFKIPFSFTRSKKNSVILIFFEKRPERTRVREFHYHSSSFFKTSNTSLHFQDGNIFINGVLMRPATKHVLQKKENIQKTDYLDEIFGHQWKSPIPDFCKAYSWSWIFCSKHYGFFLNPNPFLAKSASWNVLQLDFTEENKIFCLFHTLLKNTHSSCSIFFHLR